ncbi:MAG: hypothetical protein ACRDLA_13300, partial [Thermoleophilaceae bacterium]
LLFIPLLLAGCIIQFGLIVDQDVVESTGVAQATRFDVAHENGAREAAVAADLMQHGAAAPRPPSIWRPDGAPRAALDNRFQAGRDAPRAPPRT